MALLMPKARTGNLRWTICALLFFATSINYIDRNVIGILKPELQKEIGWTEIEYSNIVVAFNLAYAISLVTMGWVIDKVGTLRGFAASVVWWSLAAMSTALAKTPVGFGLARFLLGIGEGGNFPASIKTVAEWFPKKERALATGVFNAGTNVGAIVTPLAIPWVFVHWGWQGAFLATGAIGFLWLFAWYGFYRPPEEHPRLSAAEGAHIRSDPPDPPAVKIPWLKLIPHRQTWAFALGKFLTDPVWWFYLFWIADFLQKDYGLDLQGRSLPLAVIYIVSSVGSVGGGWLSGALIRRGWSVNAARKTTMLICALLVVPIAFAPGTKSMWGAVALVSIAAAAHQGWSANIFTTASDMFPRAALGSVVGFGGMMGSVGGMLVAKIVGYVLQWWGSYLPVFVAAASLYLIALAVIQLLVPTLAPAKLGETA
jgi:ACS family hexuronate transporter-like MFS transporter